MHKLLNENSNRKQKSHGKIPLVELLAAPFFTCTGGENISSTIQSNSSVWLSLNVVSLFLLFSPSYISFPFNLRILSVFFIAPSFRCVSTPHLPPLATVSVCLRISTLLLLWFLLPLLLYALLLLLYSFPLPLHARPSTRLHSPSYPSPRLPLSASAQCMNSVFSLIFVKCNFPFAFLAYKMQSVLYAVDW